MGFANPGFSKEIHFHQLAVPKALSIQVCNQAPRFPSSLAIKDWIITSILPLQGPDAHRSGVCAAGFLQWPLVGCKEGGDNVYKDEHDSMA
jgi:hypothetical protein